MVSNALHVSPFGGRMTPLGEAVATTVDSFRRSAHMTTS
jgi:hypothetical protein